VILISLVAGSIASCLALLTIVATQGMSGHVSADLLVLGYGGGWFLLFGIAAALPVATGATGRRAVRRVFLAFGVAGGASGLLIVWMLLTHHLGGSPGAVWRDFAIPLVLPWTLGFSIDAWWRRGKTSEIRLPRPPGPVADVQMKLSQLALEIAAEDHRSELDFSHESIKVVEVILAELHREYARTGDESGLHGVAMEFGAYIATTIQRTTGEGVLERADPRFPEALFPFRFSGGTIYPCDWCAKRLFDGEADDVWSKYSVLVLEPLKNRTAAAG
jgi:hypothetical protein